MKNIFIALLGFCLCGCVVLIKPPFSKQIPTREQIPYKYKEDIAAAIIVPEVKDKYFFYHLDGTPVTSQELFSSPKTVLFFWTTWCPYCLIEIKNLNKKCPSAKGVKFYYINPRQPKEKIEEKIRSIRLKNCITDDILMDQKGHLLRRYNVIGIPTYIFFKDGAVVHRSYSFNESVLKRAFGNE